MQSTLNPSDTSYHSFLKELYNLLHQSAIISRAPATASYKSNENQAEDHHPKSILGKVELYMDKRLAEPLNLQALADEAALSKYQLIRRFKAETGITPWQHLIQKRIERAQELLEEGKSAAQVALETGFYDQSHMNRAFREETGLTPGKYQQKVFKNTN